MNRDIADDKWQQLKGKIQQQWGKITDDDMDGISGKREEFVGVMQEKHGKAKEEFEEAFEALLGDDE